MQRQQQAAVTSPPELESSRIIDVLLDVIRHPHDDASAVSRRLGALGQTVTREQAEAIFARYDLKKTVRSRWRRSRR